MMNKNKQVCLLFVLTISSISCKNQASEVRKSMNKDTATVLKESNTGKIKQEQIDTKVLYETYGSLALSPIGQNPDKLVFAFFKFGNNNDTSWSLAAYKLDSTIFIKVNEVTPKNIAESFTTNYDSLSFKKYDGYNCKVTEAFWHKLINETGLENYEVKSPTRREVVGGRSYSLYYADKVIVDSREDLPYLMKIDTLFSKAIVNKINYKAAHPPSRYVE